MNPLRFSNRGVVCTIWLGFVLWVLNLTFTLGSSPSLNPSSTIGKDNSKSFVDKLLRRKRNDNINVVSPLSTEAGGSILEGNEDKEKTNKFSAVGNNIFSNFGKRKKRSIPLAEVEKINKMMMDEAFRLQHGSENEGWEFVAERKGVKVMRKFMPPMHGKKSKFCCVRASGFVDASPDDIAELYEGDTRVAEYNKYYASGRDIEFLNANTKVVWASSPPIFPFKARDYCTYVHYRRFRDGTTIVLNRAAVHEEAPPTQDYCRAQILLGASIIEPVPGNPKRSKFTTICQIDPGGSVPAFAVNKLCAHGPIQFHQAVEKAAKRTYLFRDKSKPSFAAKYSGVPGVEKGVKIED